MQYLKMKKEELDKKQLLFRTLMMIIARIDFQVDSYIQSKAKD